MTRFTLSVLIAALALPLLAPADADAVPAFARRHQLSCTVCHDPFPRLKPFGEEYAGNGFFLPEDDPDRNYTRDGDPRLRLMRDLPLAVRMDAYVLFEQDNSRAETDLQTPWGLKLLSGGTLARNVGYYFYFYMSERGEVAGAEDAYIHFNDLLGQPLDIMVGQFQTSDPLMKRELRLTYEDYLVYKQRIGASRMNLAYDRGFLVTYDIEATGTGLAGMLVNGNGIPTAGDKGVYDQDDSKSLAGRLTQDLGGVAMLGGFYYRGDETLAHDQNEVSYLGVDGAVTVDRFTFTGQFLRREDSLPEADKPDVVTDGFVGELIFAPRFDRSTHYVTVLYNRLDSDIDDHDYESLTGNVTYLLASNLRLNLEYTQVLAEGAAGLDYGRASVGVIGAF
jgi:hypothetical protein